MYICVVGEKEYGIKIDPGNLLSRNIVYSRNLLSVRENIKGFPGGTSDKQPACKCRKRKETGLIPGSGRSPGGGYGNPLLYPWRVWQPTPISLPGKSHGQRNLAGCSPWCRKESRHYWSDLACMQGEYMYVVVDRFSDQVKYNLLLLCLPSFLLT